jgi:hypothetical protein
MRKAVYAALMGLALLLTACLPATFWSNLSLLTPQALQALTPQAQGMGVKRGVVAYPTLSGCDYFIVATNMGYSLLQLWSFTVFKPQKGDIVVGELESYGFKDVINLTRNVTYRVWVEDFWLSANRVIEKYLRKCPY